MVIYGHIGTTQQSFKLSYQNVLLSNRNGVEEPIGTSGLALALSVYKRYVFSGNNLLHFCRMFIVMSKNL